MTRYTRRELEIADHLWDCLSRIAEDKGTDPQVVLNQAVYDLARRFNFLAPVSSQGAAQKKSAIAAPAVHQSAPREGGASRKPMPVPPKTATASKASLFVVDGAGEMHKIEKDSFVIGRSRNCDLVISSSKVSRQHCTVSRDGEEYFIEDLGSPNGVWRDGVKITKEKIKDGDQFMISDEVLKFVFRTAAQAARKV
jgi:hypothetical protein